MAITVSFTAGQTSGNPSGIDLVDTSTGSDVTAVSRRIYITNAAGEYITEAGVTTAVAYTSWPIIDGNSLTLDVLTEDSALDITLSYLNVSNAVVATDTELSGFTLYNETFYYSTTQAMASQSSPPPIIQDTNYYNSKMQLRVLIDSGNQAISLGSDISSAQNCYNMASYIVANQNDFF